MLGDLRLAIVRCFLVFLVVLLLGFLVVGGRFCVFGFVEGDAWTAIVVAENGVFDGYRVVLDAEEAGADVSGLLGVLDEAGDLLFRANLAYDAGDFDSAVDFAVQSQEKLDGFIGEAGVLRENALQQRYWDFMLNVVGSIIITGIVVCIGLVVWFSLKRRYLKAGGVG